MSRVLVVGTVPPAGDVRARALADVAVARLSVGDEVEIVSPDLRSVAHTTARLSGLRLPLRLFADARRFDAVVLRVEHRLPFTGREGRLGRAAVLLLLGLALRRYDQVTLRLDSPIPIPGGSGGRATKALWSQAKVVVESELDRDLILAVPWLDEDRVEVVPPGGGTGLEVRPPWPEPGVADLRSAVLDVVRVRARAARRLGRSSEEDFDPVEVADARLDLSAAFEAASQPTVRPRLGLAARRALRGARHRVRRRLRR